MVALERAIRAGLFRAVLIGAAGAVLFACLAGAVGFVLLGLYARFSLEMDTVPAALVTAVVALAAAGAIVGLAALATRTGAPPSAKRCEPRAGDDLALLRAALGDSAEWVEGHPRTGVLAAFAVGVVLGFSPSLRDRLTGGLADLVGKSHPAA